MSITRIYAQNLKGQNIDQPIGRLTIFCGPNGAGKSARTDALKIALLGYVPGSGKGNAEILNTFGNGKLLDVGFQAADKSRFYRCYREKDGTVSQSYMLGNRKANRDQFAAEIAPYKIFDLRAFLDLSDQKKIDWIFDLYPPEGLGDLDAQIETKRAKQNKLTADIRALDQTRARLTAARSQIALPAGTLAELVAKIASTELQLSGARNALQEARIEQARAEEQEKAQIVERLTVPPAIPTFSDPIPMTEPIATMADPLPSFADPFSADCSPMGMGANSIQSILDTMNRTGCEACTAALVAKRELRKFRKGVAA